MIKICGGEFICGIFRCLKCIIKVQFTSCVVNLLQRRTESDLFLFRIFSFDLSKEIWSIRPISLSAHFVLSLSVAMPLFASETTLSWVITGLLLILVACLHKRTGFWWQRVSNESCLKWRLPSLFLNVGCSINPRVQCQTESLSSSHKNTHSSSFSCFNLSACTEYEEPAFQARQVSS